ncbi:MAG: hypothetical protein EPN61_12515 [Burkholderiaceae bacterium]|nr:MAG: hypothetical protein EPN61_12515 [Burkholderiaceae bacterium]
MSDLPSGTFLGDLSMGHVVEYYDFPRLFTCRSITGQSYIAISTFDDETESHWIYLPVSSLRLESLLSGSLPLRRALKQPEGGYLIRIVSRYKDQAHTASYVLPEQIPDEDFPSSDYSIVVSDQASEPDVSLTAQQVATATRRETFNYRIFPDQPSSHEIPARKLGGILTSTQELVDALGQAALGEPTVRGPIAADLLHQTRVNVSHSFWGSFGVQFRSTQLSDLLDESVLAAALRQLTYLLEAEDSEDLLSNKLHALKGRVASKYRRLLKELSDVDSGITLDWGSVSATGGGQFLLTAAQVKRAYAIVDRIDVAMSEEITVSGKLIGFNSRTQRYEILSSDDGRAYAGKVSDEAKIEVLNPAIGQFYEADLKMLVETQSSSGDELVRWVLVRLGATPAARGT